MTLHDDMHSSDRKAVMTPKRRLMPIILAAVFLAAYAILALTLPFEPALRTQTVSLLSKDATTFLLTIVATLWGASAYFRCSDSTIKHYIFCISGLILLWSIISITKHLTHNNLIESLLWYAYYLPITLIPTLMLFCTLHIVLPDNRPLTRNAKIFCLSVTFALSFLVLTNNVHQLAFEFSFDNEQWRHQHSYGPVYFAVFAWIAIQGICIVCLLFTASRKQLRKALVVVAGVALFGMAYSVLYNLRVGPAFTTPLAIVFSLLYITIMELCLRTGLFPSCSDYMQAFKELPLDVKLLSIDGSQSEQTRMAKPAQADLFPTALDAIRLQNEPASFKLQNNPDESFNAYSILGGTAVVTEDIASINQRKHDLEIQQSMLRQQNALLEQYRVAQTELHRKHSENELFRNVEISLAESVATIKLLLNGIEKQANENPSESNREQRLTLLKVKLLVSYCKRKGGIVLIEHENSDFERSRLNLMINETLSDIRPAGIDCAALIETDDLLPVSTTSICCDCLYAFAMTALDCDDPTIMLFLQNKNDSFVELRIVLEDALAKNIANSAAIVKLENTLKTSEADFTIERSDEAVILSVLMLRKRR